MYAALFRSQTMTALLAERAVAQMLADQHYTGRADGTLVPTQFTTGRDSFTAMLDAIPDDATRRPRIERLTRGLTQEAARTAQQTAVAVRADVRWVRHLSLPSCARCAVLAGRVYRYSQGFQRHPGCDCVMLPVTVANPDLAYDPVELAKSGQVTGLSKADERAIDHGADFGQVVNIRSRRAGLTVAGHALARNGRLTPAGIFDRAGDDRAYAVELLFKYGYLH